MDPAGAGLHVVDANRHYEDGRGGRELHLGLCKKGPNSAIRERQLEQFDQKRIEMDRYRQL